MSAGIFVELGLFIVLAVGALIFAMWAKPYLKFNNYLNAFKIGLLQKAGEREGIDLEENVKAMKRKDIESIIDAKMAEALDVDEEFVEIEGGK